MTRPPVLMMLLIVAPAMMLPALTQARPEVAKAGRLYPKIAAAYPDARLSPAEVTYAQMQGKCLVGLKDINFRKKQEFDPVAEWTNYRSLSLLEQFPPCTVLIMMETARKDLMEEQP